MRPAFPASLTVSASLTGDTFRYTVLLPTAVPESHGWRDCVVADQDGNTFAIGQAL